MSSCSTITGYSWPRTALESAEMLAGLGYEPVTVDIGEFQKLEGCVTCLSVRLSAPARTLSFMSPATPGRSRPATSPPALPPPRRRLRR